MKKAVKKTKDRRVYTDKFHKENSKRLDVITKTLKKQDEVLKDIDKNTKQHFKDDEAFQVYTKKFQVDTNDVLVDLKELIPIVREQLLPAYQREMDLERARALIAAETKKYGDWGKFFLTFMTVGGAILAFIKFYVQKT